MKERVMAQSEKSSEKSSDKTEDLAAQVARLQAQVNALMGAPVTPDLAGFVGRAEAAISDAGGVLREACCGRRPRRSASMFASSR
jgi:hypothetical protein